MPDARSRTTLHRAARALERLVHALAVPDHLPPTPDGTLVLFGCHDADRGMRDAGGRYSQLLEGIRRHVVQLGYVPLNLTHPFAALRSDQVRDGSITVNRRALLGRIEAVVRQALDAGAGARLEVETRLYGGLLQRLRPRLVFAIQPPLGLCRAARRLGLLVVEPMHGNNISLHDRHFMEHMGRPDEVLPQVLLAFDDVTQATLREVCRGRDVTPLRARHPWVQLCRREAVLRQAAAPVSAQTVLLSLQWGYDGERDALSGIVPNGILHPAIERAIELTAGRGWRWRVRMHPVQVTTPGYRHHRRYLERLATHHSHVELERATAMPLPLLLDEVSAHVTMSSASVGEAALAGVPSLLLCPTLQPGGANHGLFLELEAADQAAFGRLDAHAIVDWLDRCPPRTRVPQDAGALAIEHEADNAFYRHLLDGAASRPVAPSGPQLANPSARGLP